MKDEMNVTPEHKESKSFSRRKFLGYAGGIAGAGLLITSCKKEPDDIIPEEGTLDLGTNDKGLINLMFVSQQLEADFYHLLLETPFSGITGAQWELFSEIRDHEIAHREFLRNYLDGDGTVVTTDFSQVDFSNKSQVLQVAEQLEELVVAMGNEVCRLFSFGDNLELIAKMVSVEARHAGTISNMISEGAYFNPIDASGAEQGLLPSNAVITMNKYLATKVSGNNLPNK